MDGSHFDDLLRSLTRPRRSLLGGSLALATGWLGVSAIDAKKKRKHKKRKAKKAKPNEFGCLELGDPCQSEDQCCSGICEGKKGKKTCRAHDTGTCDQTAVGYCEAENPNLTVCNGGNCLCFATTAGSNVCTNNVTCTDCKRDADCLALGFPRGSACAPVGGDLACDVLCPETGMACIAPCGSGPA